MLEKAQHQRRCPLESVGSSIVLFNALRLNACNQPDNFLRRSAECFVQLLNLLNIDYSPEAGTQLCEKVLATLMALLAGNEASRKQLQQGVGYDTLLSIVLKCSGPSGPSGGILMQLLHLVLEVLHPHSRLYDISHDFTHDFNSCHFCMHCTSYSTTTLVT